MLVARPALAGASGWRTQRAAARPRQGPAWRPRQGQHGVPMQDRLQAVGRTQFSVETKRLTKIILTRQAVKTMLGYLSETNGELHLWLHTYLSDNPLALDPSKDPDDWLVTLATTPLTKVQDPRRSSIVSPATEAAVMNGEREVSPREVAERILALRAHIAEEVAEDCQCIHLDNKAVLKKALEKTLGGQKGRP